jgi:hypothetical protein
MSPSYPSEPTWDDLGRVFQQAFNSSSKEYQQHLARLAGSDGYEVAPIRGMLAGCWPRLRCLVSYVRRCRSR